MRSSQTSSFTNLIAKDFDTLPECKNTNEICSDLLNIIKYYIFRNRCLDKIQLLLIIMS